MTEDQIIERLLTYEGGYSDIASDHGGPTNYGITAADYGRYKQLGRVASPQEVQQMTRAEAVEIYRAWYIAAPGFNQITDSYLELVVVDSGVISGTVRATKWLQQALDLNPDGKIGPDTKAKLGTLDPASSVVAAHRVLALRFQNIGRIVTADHTQLGFLAGWINRAVSLLQEA